MTVQMDMTLDQLAENFELLGDWDARFDYLIDLGRGLRPLAEAEHCEANRVHGCQAQVWLIMRRRADSEIIDITADSDAFIVKGLIAVLLMMYSGRSAAEILAIDGVAAMSRLGLDQHLSPTRKNGLFSMLKRIRQLATEIAAPHESTP
ncbi:MAG: Cysteine desulfuration protein SufE [Nitrospira sp.]|nr:Cysteine desulfuration protein SufE [Nitrospira sp.]